jgi:DNA recombination protein RmuC
VEAYNATVGSLERQVLPQARRFPELGVTADAPLPTIEPIEELARPTLPPRAPDAPDAREP